MRRVILAALLLLTPLFTGCAASDLIFGVLNNYYSGGGPTSNDRQYHHDRQMEAWEDYNRYGSEP